MPSPERPPRLKRDRRSSGASKDEAEIEQRAGGRGRNTRNRAGLDAVLPSQSLHGSPLGARKIVRSAVRGKGRTEAPRPPAEAGSRRPVLRATVLLRRYDGALVAAFGQGMRAPCRDAGRVRSVRGDGAPKSAKSLWLVPCGTRAPRGAPITATCGTGPAFVRSVAHRIGPTDAVSQLLAGPPSGPGGSSNAARVPRCDEARRHRTSSRLHDAS